MSKKFCIRCHNKTKYSGKKTECSGHCKKKIVYFMRGGHSCGKSYTSKLIAGKKGVVIETDKFFERPGRKFRFIHAKIDEAYTWVYKELKKAVRSETRTIVIDRGNSPSKFSKKLMKYAIKHGYKVELAEPISEWWEKTRYLLFDRPFSNYKLKDISVLLSEKNQHRMKPEKIYERLLVFNQYLTVDDFLNYKRKK